MLGDLARNPSSRVPEESVHSRYLTRGLPLTYMPGGFLLATVLQLLSGGRPSLGGRGAGHGSIRPCCRSLMLEKLPVLKKLGRYGGKAGF